MGDEASSLDISIRTQYEGSGNEAARADIAKTTEATERSQEEIAASNARLAQERAEATAFVNAGEEKENMAKAAGLAIDEEKNAILATRKALVTAVIAGDEQEAAIARSEIAIRQLTLQSLQREAITQAEINELRRDETLLIEEASAAVARKAAAEEAEAAAQGSHVYGPRMGGARILRNFGLGQDMVASIGIGLFAGMEIKRMIDEQTEAIRKQTEELQKQTQAWHDQSMSVIGQINSARSMSDMDKARDEAQKRIDELEIQRASASGEEAQRIKNQIVLMEALIQRTFQLGDAAKDRITPEEAVKNALEQQDRALKSQLDSIKEQMRLRHEALEDEDQLAKAKLDAALQDIEIQEKNGKISHEKAAERIADLKKSSEEERFAAHQAAMEQDKADLLEETKKLNAADMSRRGNVKPLSGDVSASEYEEKRAQRQVAARRNIQFAEEKLKALEDLVSGRISTWDKSVLTEDEMMDVPSTKKQYTARREKAQKDLVDTGTDIDLATATKARVTAQTNLANAQKDMATRYAAAQAEFARITAAVRELNRKLEQAQKLRGITAPMHAQAEHQAIQTGKGKDEEAAAKAKAKADKEAAELAKKNAPLIAESEGIQSRAREDIGAGLQGTANAHAAAILDHLKTDQLNKGGLKDLAAALGKIAPYLAEANAATARDMAALKSEIDNLLNQLGGDRHTADHAQ